MLDKHVYVVFVNHSLKKDPPVLGIADLGDLLQGLSLDITLCTPYEYLVI